MGFPYILRKVERQMGEGLILVNTGDGKGKTTAALGVALRSAGCGRKVLILQFIKSGANYGELAGIALLPTVEIRSMGKGFIFHKQDESEEKMKEHQQAAKEAWAMVETEVKSGQWDLIILDEIGRGTSTFDGLSIAQAVVEHICKHIHAKTLFATHYHELIPLEDVYPRLKNYTVAVKEKGKDIAFLRRIIRGGADRSYGIHVAKLAGLPAQVLKRAEVILESLEEQNTDTDDLNNRVITSDSVVKYTKPSIEQDDFGNLFTHSVVDSLLAIDVNTMTPIEALNTIHQLQAEARNGGGK